MSTVGLLGLTALAFLAPLPPERFSAREPPKGVGLAICAVAGLLLVVTVVPLSLALADKWAMDARAQACRASGGQFAYVPSASGWASRCERSNP